MSKSTDSQIESAANLRDALYADKHVWIDEIDDLLRGLKPDILNENWVVNDGLYKDGSAYRPASDKHYKDGKGGFKTVQFSYCPSYYGASDWIPRIRHFWVTYGTKWDSELDVDGGGYGLRTDGPSAFADNTRTESKYVVGGLLADTLATSSVERVVHHIEEQFERVKDRVLLNLEIERMAADGRTSNQGDPAHTSPVRVYGVGEDTVERLARHFGAYSNILQYDESYVHGHLSTSWGANPSSSLLLEEVDKAVSRYIDAYHNGEVKSSLLPEDLANYPQKQPERLGTNSTLHTSRQGEPEDGQNKSRAPQGCVRGSADETTHIGSLRTLSITARGDGVWVLKPTRDAHDGAFEMLIPFGTEQQERRLAQRWYGYNLQDTYLHDVYIATQLLEYSWDVCATPPSAHRQPNNTSVDTDTIDTANTEITEQTLDNILSNTTEILSKDTGWTPSVRSAEGLHVGDAPELEYLLDCLPKNLVDGWDSQVFQGINGNQAWFNYNPEDIKKTTWVRKPGQVRIHYSDDYDSATDVDDVSDETASKYVLDGLLVDPIATQSAARFFAHVEEQFEQVEEAVRFNAMVERVHFKQDVSGSTTTAEVGGQTTIFSKLTGIGPGTERQLASEYGTYANLVRADTVNVNLSYHFSGTTDDIQNLIEPTVKKCLETCDYEADKWADYPKS